VELPILLWVGSIVSIWVDLGPIFGIYLQLIKIHLVIHLCIYTLVVDISILVKPTLIIPIITRPSTLIIKFNMENGIILLKCHITVKEE